MKVVLQKVSQASVRVGATLISQINTGYVLLVGIASTDTPDDIHKISAKVLKLKLFPDSNEAHWKRSIVDVNGEILSISQFTLLAKYKKNKPDFHHAMSGDAAKVLYNQFLSDLQNVIGKESVKDGEFGALMSCTLTNEGPVTMILGGNGTVST